MADQGLNAIRHTWFNLNDLKVLADDLRSPVIIYLASDFVAILSSSSVFVLSFITLSFFDDLLNPVVMS